MAKRKIRLTDWFPSEVQPTLPGWYNVKCANNSSRFEIGEGANGRVNGMRFWDGRQWLLVPHGRSTNFGVLGWCKDYWRGLAENPSKDR